MRSHCLSDLQQIAGIGHRSQFGGDDRFDTSTWLQSLPRRDLNAQSGLDVIDVKTKLNG